MSSASGLHLSSVMTRVFWLTACLAIVGGCDERDAPAAPAARSAPPATPATQTTSRVPKVADPHFRELLAAIADARACKEVRHTFHTLRSAADPNTVTGDLW